MCYSYVVCKEGKQQQSQSSVQEFPIEKSFRKGVLFKIENFAMDLNESVNESSMKIKVLEV
jgi:hypothetical protein